MEFRACVLLLLAGLVLGQDLEELKDMARMARDSLVQHQFYLREHIRTEGASGIVQGGGVQSFAAMNDDHIDKEHMIGQGTFDAVINGVSFRTSGEGFRLEQPSTTSGDHLATETIDHPEVPAYIKALEPDEQLEKMKQLFRNFEESNNRNDVWSGMSAVPHFKPVICLLEGYWSTKKPLKPGQATTYLGNTTNPILAQFEHRVICHPLEQGIPPNRMKLVDDMAARLKHNLSLNEYRHSPYAHFVMSMKNSSAFLAKSISGPMLLDDLVMQVPGHDNYDGYQEDNSYGSGINDTRGGILNAAYYHRFFKKLAKDAMGVNVRKRGYNDMPLFMAYTGQDDIPAFSIYKCRTEGKRKNATKICTDYTSRVTYAIPLEIIYLSPLAKWNPNNVESSAENFVHTPAGFLAGGCGGSELCPSGQRGVVDVEGVGKVRLRYPIARFHDDGNGAAQDLEALKHAYAQPVANEKAFYAKPTIPALLDTPVDDPKANIQARVTQGDHNHVIVTEYPEGNGWEKCVVTDVKDGHLHVGYLKKTANKSFFTHKCCVEELPATDEDMEQLCKSCVTDNKSAKCTKHNKRFHKGNAKYFTL